jgi:DNA-directed RNA polymerase subunit omega
MDTFGDKVDSKFRFVLLSARRAEQIIRGARPRVEAHGVKTARIAMQEIKQGLINWDYGPAPEATPETLEVGTPAADAVDVH